MRALPAEIHQMLLPLDKIVGPDLHQAIVIWITQRFDHDLIEEGYSAKTEAWALICDLVIRLSEFEINMIAKEDK